MQSYHPLAVPLCVLEHCAGISRNDQKRIFELFQQVDMRDQRTFGGSGIGLSICKLLMDTMGGRIWVESEGSGGSTFFVRVPLEPLHRKPLATHASLDGTTHVVVAHSRRRVAESVEAVVADAGATVTVVVPQSAAAMCEAAAALFLATPKPVAVVCEAAVLSRPLLDKCAESHAVVFPQGPKFQWEDGERDHTALQRIAPGAPPTSVVVALQQQLEHPEAASRLEERLHARAQASIPTVDVAATSLTPKQAPRRSHLPVLAVDDQKVNLKMLTRMLTRSGYEVVTAVDGQEALDLSKRQEFSLILMDVMVGGSARGRKITATQRCRVACLAAQMPRMNGLEASRRIREHDSLVCCGLQAGGASPRRDLTPRGVQTPIVAVTASVAPEDVAEVSVLCMTPTPGRVVCLTIRGCASVQGRRHDLLPGKAHYQRPGH